MTPLTRLTRHALIVSALTLWAATAQAAFISTNSHFLTADTSVSEEQQQRVDAVDGVRFNGAQVSQGLGSQGAVGTARALQDVLFDAEGGASGFVESAVNLGTGISGSAESLLFVAFDLSGQSRFTLDGFSEVEGNAFTTRRLLLRQVVADVDPVEIFSVDFSDPSFSLSGLLEAGRYLLNVSTHTASADPGEGGHGRISFDFAFDAVTGGQTVPAPSPIALAAVAMGLMAAGALGRRASGGSPRQPAQALAA